MPNCIHQLCAVSDVAFDERAPLHSPAVAVHQIVVDYRRKSTRSQCLCSMAADVPGTPSDKNVLFVISHSLSVRKKQGGVMTDSLKFAPPSRLQSGVGNDLRRVSPNDQ